MNNNLQKNQIATMMAINAIDEAIRNLKLQRQALAATMPVEPKKMPGEGKRFITNPYTGKKEFY